MLTVTQKQMDETDPAGAMRRAVDRQQLDDLQTARESAGWFTIEGLALNVAIDLHIGRSDGAKLSMHHLLRKLARK